jgi:hypothetical protein
MTYMALIYGPPMPPNFVLPPEGQKAWMDYTAALQAAGVFISGEQLEDTTAATTVSMHDGKPVFTDGPFAETKEVLGGYYMFSCANLDEALQWAAKCPGVAMGGKIEVRPIVER